MLITGATINLESSTIAIAAWITTCSSLEFPPSTGKLRTPGLQVGEKTVSSDWHKEIHVGFARTNLHMLNDPCKDTN
jgi:hypothetical protein